MQMAREDANKYKDEITNLYWTGKISIKEFDKRWDEIELEPYDLSAFPTLSETTKEWINKIFDDVPTTNKRGNFIIFGFTRAERAIMQVLNLTYGEYADAISFYAYNDEEMIMFEYTEGDINIQLFLDRDSYEKEKKYTENWYKEERCA